MEFDCGPKSRQAEVIVVGAGPCGLLTALRLGQANVQVDILETASELDQRPRATHYSSPAVIELRKAGVFEDVEKAGFHPRLVTWRKPDGTEIARMPMSTLEINYPYPMVCLPVSALGGILMSHISKLPNIKVLWGHRVVKTGQSDHDAWVDVMKNGSLFEKIGITSKMKALWIVGTDGANSTIRKDLGLTFEGSTWDKQLVATNVYYPFDEKNGWTDSNFIITPDNWFMAAKITKDGLWRVTYGEVMGCSDEELVDRQASKFEKMILGAPQPSDYKLVSISPYKIHQRRANRFREGRFLLAGDAAHICNPFGGLGLTGGIVDAGNLSDALIGVIAGLADESILNKYSEIRIKAFDEIVNPVSTENFQRISEQDPETVLATDKFLAMLANSNSDPKVVDFLHTKVMELQHDFTQYYHKCS
ncbi:FAD/NAD(P)-binding domain-containing protein [Hyaloscypha variabilis F]|uniref:FAD/NAD(P)-binding domain-containing protein n=1 Tax=Hyaloscypha variabilis (strain UAMH 11265 / GT02V1 / F) TaxID=1149755 RepID=A0A2J6SE85_HYAVF|nr:FAD/NAD(P)-binding domain-containing protein [Hyaloscypha variabilis F]